MKKIFHLANCTTCQRILKEINPGKDVELREIKSSPITQKEIEEMRKRTDSYESLFSRRAIKYRSMKLKEKKLTEEDYKKLILEEYTFLKRPVAIIGDEIFIGNSKKVVESLYNALKK